MHDFIPIDYEGRFFIISFSLRFLGPLEISWSPGSRSLGMSSAGPRSHDFRFFASLLHSHERVKSFVVEQDEMTGRQIYLNDRDKLNRIIRTTRIVTISPEFCFGRIILQIFYHRLDVLKNILGCSESNFVFFKRKRLIHPYMEYILFGYI